MGNEVSTESGGETYGFRVLGIQKGSPCASVGFVSFFDFIVAANGVRLDTRDQTFLELIAQHEDKDLHLDVYNIKSDATREILVRPSQKWDGKGLLGVTIRFDNFDEAQDQLLHVLDIEPSSPASVAGLVAFEDYVLGTPEHVFHDADDFFDDVLDHVNRPMDCYIYSARTDEVRCITIKPSDEWGGEGYLGAEIGFGYLHRLPTDCRKSTGTTSGFVIVPKEQYVPRTTEEPEELESSQSEKVLVSRLDNISLAPAKQRDDGEQESERASSSSSSKFLIADGSAIITPRSSLQP